MKNSIIALLIILVLVLGGYAIWGHKKVDYIQPVPVENSLNTVVSLTTQTSTNNGSSVSDISTQGWNTFTNKFGLSLKYPNGWTIGDASYQAQGVTVLFVWVLGPKRPAPAMYGYTQAQFDMALCYTNGTFTNQCYGSKQGEILQLLYPGGTQAPNNVMLKKDDVVNTDEYKTAMAILATATASSNSQKVSCLSSDVPWIRIDNPKEGLSYTTGQSVSIDWQACNVSTFTLGLVSGGKDFGEIYTYHNLDADVSPLQHGLYTWTATNPAQGFTSSAINKYQIAANSYSPAAWARSQIFSVQ